MVNRDGLCGVASPAPCGRTPDDVGERAIGLDEVEVGSCEIFKWMTQVAYKGDGLQKYLRQHDRRPYVQVDAATVHAAHEFCEQAKIRVRGRPQSSAVHARMKMRDVRADGDVRREGYALGVGGAE